MYLEAKRFLDKYGYTPAVTEFMDWLIYSGDTVDLSSADLWNIIYDFLEENFSYEKKSFSNLETSLTEYVEKIRVGEV